MNAPREITSEINSCGDFAGSLNYRKYSENGESLHVTISFAMVSNCVRLFLSFHLKFKKRENGGTTSKEAEEGSTTQEKEEGNHPKEGEEDRRRRPRSTTQKKKRGEAAPTSYIILL